VGVLMGWMPDCVKPFQDFLEELFLEQCDPASFLIPGNMHA
jgi:hypothetical protein